MDYVCSPNCVSTYLPVKIWNLLEKASQACLSIPVLTYFVQIEILDQLSRIASKRPVNSCSVQR